MPGKKGRRASKQTPTKAAATAKETPPAAPATAPAPAAAAAAAATASSDDSKSNAAATAATPTPPTAAPAAAPSAAPPSTATTIIAAVDAAPASDTKDGSPPVTATSTVQPQPQQPQAQSPPLPPAPVASAAIEIESKAAAAANPPGGQPLRTPQRATAASAAAAAAPAPVPTASSFVSAADAAAESNWHAQFQVLVTRALEKVRAQHPELDDVTARAHAIKAATQWIHQFQPKFNPDAAQPQPQPQPQPQASAPVVAPATATPAPTAAPAATVAASNTATTATILPSTAGGNGRTAAFADRMRLVTDAVYAAVAAGCVPGEAPKPVPNCPPERTAEYKRLYDLTVERARDAMRAHGAAADGAVGTAAGWMTQVHAQIRQRLQAGQRAAPPAAAATATAATTAAAAVGDSKQSSQAAVVIAGTATGTAAGAGAATTRQWASSFLPPPEAYTPPPESKNRPPSLPAACWDPRLLDLLFTQFSVVDAEAIAARIDNRGINTVQDFTLLTRDDLIELKFDIGIRNRMLKVITVLKPNVHPTLVPPAPAPIVVHPPPAPAAASAAVRPSRTIIKNRYIFENAGSVEFNLPATPTSRANIHAANRQYDQKARDDDEDDDADDDDPDAYSDDDDPCNDGSGDRFVDRSCGPVKFTAPAH